MKIFFLLLIMAVIPFGITITCELEFGGTPTEECLLVSEDNPDGRYDLPDNLNDSVVDISSVSDETGSGSFITGMKTASRIKDMLIRSVSLGSVIRAFWQAVVPMGIIPPNSVFLAINYVSYFIYSVGLASLVIRMRLQD